MIVIDADYLIDLIESKTDLEFDEITEKELVRMIREQPTLDEKEIIRKAFERVVERLEGLMNNMERYKNDNDLFMGEYRGFGMAIEIIKEECGINE